VRGPAGAPPLPLVPGSAFIVAPGGPSPEAQVADAEIVFVGYGIVAPEYQWDDFKDADLKGKVLLVMNNDPEDDPALFAGKTRLYYGRWDYKYEQAARTGAVAALVIHTTPSAGYPWQVVQTSWAGEQFHLPETDAPHLQVEGWVTDEAAHKLASLGGQDLDRLRAAAQKRDFRPVPLGVQIDVALHNTITRKKTANVIGKLAGSDPKLASQAVFFTAHHDHLGIKTDAKPGEDTIYNGAFDNATGVAALLTMADAMGSMRVHPRRSVYFAAVAAEEQGLLGSQYLVAHCPVPLGRVAADINMDGVNVIGPTRDIQMIGLGKSSLDDVARELVAAQGRTLLPDQFPDRGHFYRSDQFNFAKAGVPSAYFDYGTDVIGKPPGWGKQWTKHFEETDYHQPSDEIKSDWDWRCAVQDVRLFYELGLRVADAPEMPAWHKGDEFEVARKKALALSK